jgi:hypothetical protein
VDIFNDEMPTFFLKQFTITSAPNLHLAACLRSLSIEVFNGKEDAPVPCTDVFIKIHCYF